MGISAVLSPLRPPSSPTLYAVHLVHHSIPSILSIHSTLSTHYVLHPLYSLHPSIHYVLHPLYALHHSPPSIPLNFSSWPPLYALHPLHQSTPSTPICPPSSPPLHLDALLNFLKKKRKLFCNNQYLTLCYFVFSFTDWYCTSGWLKVTRTSVHISGKRRELIFLHCLGTLYGLHSLK